MIEAWLKFTDELPGKGKMDNYFDGDLDVINYLYNSNIGIRTYTSDDLFLFQLFPNDNFAMCLLSDNELYCSHYKRNIVLERWEDPNVLNVINNTFPSNWPEIRLPLFSTLGELPISQLLTRIYTYFINDNVRKDYLIYFTLVERKVQLDYGIQSDYYSSSDGDYILLPVEVRKYEELEEELSSVQETLQLRRLKFGIQSGLM